MALAAVAHRLIAMPKLEGPGVAHATGDFRMGGVRMYGCVDQWMAFEQLILIFFKSMTRKAKGRNFWRSQRIIFGERTVTLHAGLIFLCIFRQFRLMLVATAAFDFFWLVQVRFNGIIGIA